MTTKEWCQFFIKNKIIQLKEIICSSGVKSPYYCDFRMMLNYTDKLGELVSLMKNRVEEEWEHLTFESSDNTEIARVGSVPLGAVPFATILGQQMKKPTIMVRKEAKKYGKKNIIEGIMKIDDNIVMVEDVITTGGSVIDAIKKIENRGGNVKMIVCILDRQEGGMELIKYYYPNLKVVSLFTIGKLMNIAETEKLVEGYDAEKVRFHAEKGFKNMITRIRDLNEELKQQPYQENTYKWWSTHYLNSINPLVLDMVNKVVITDKVNTTGDNTDEKNIDGKQKTVKELSLKGQKLYINNIILDFCCLQDWDTIYFKLKTLGKKVRNIIVDFDTIKNWNKAKQKQLLSLQKDNGFNIIENTCKIAGWNNKLNYSYQLHHYKQTLSHISEEMYPRNLLVNSQIMNVLVSCAEDFSLLVEDIKQSIINNTIKDNYCQMFLHLNFHPKLINKLVGNTNIWKELRHAILQLNNLSGFTLNGIILDYEIFTEDVLSSWKMDKKLDLGKCVPIILHTNNQFSLHPSMVTNNINKDEEAMYNKFKKVCLKLGVSQWVIREDLLQSNVPINQKWEMYSKLFGFSNEYSNCPHRLKSGVSMLLFRDYLEEILNTPLTEFKNDTDKEKAQKQKEEIDLLMGKGRSKLSSMDTTLINENSDRGEDINETTPPKEESPEAKALRLKREFNEYQISINNVLENTREQQGKRWKIYDDKQKEKAKNKKLCDNAPKYENSIYSNVSKYGVMRSIGFYWSLLTKKIW